MIALILKEHLLWTRSDERGVLSRYYYYDWITWVVGLVALAWLMWFLVRRYRLARARRRPARRIDRALLKRVVRVKSELSERYLRPGFSANIHAVGVGKLDDGVTYCVQIFIRDANDELWAGAPPLPNNYRGVPLLLIEMPVAAFLSDAAVERATPSSYRNGIRERQEVIIGGISGANTNLTGQSGTIGYFCTRKSRFPRRKEIHLLSNSHVFADLSRAAVDANDLILQPSPGEHDSSRPIAALVNYSALKFDGDTREPNHVDAAIARLWETHRHKPVIPLIGAVKGYAAKPEVDVNEPARKFGRTTGYTEGRVFSIYLDIWIRYDRTGQSAFFQNQFLIEPTLPEFTKFVSKGDSGSLLVDNEQYATGLIFAGTSELPEALQTSQDGQAGADTDKVKRIEGYGVANPISEVLERLNIELLI